MMGLSVLHLVVGDPLMSEEDDGEQSDSNFTQRTSVGMSSTSKFDDEAQTSIASTTMKPLDENLSAYLNAYQDMSFGMACAMLVVCTLGIATNLLSIVIYSHPSMRRTPINVLLIGLSAIDLSLSVLSIPAFIIPGFFAYYRTWTLEVIHAYSAVFVYPLTSTTHTASVWTFVVIALERWHAVRQGGQQEVGASIGRQRSLLRRQRRRNCIRALITVCILSLSYNFVRFFEFELVDMEMPAESDWQMPVGVTVAPTERPWSVYTDIADHRRFPFVTIQPDDKYQYSHFGIRKPTDTDLQMHSEFIEVSTLSDGPDAPPQLATEAPPLLYTVPVVVPLLRNSTTHPFYMQVYYVGLYLVTHFVVPFVSLVIVNGLTLHVVYVAKQRRRRLLTRRERKEHRTTRMMITVVVMFVICYTLVLILNIIEAIDADWFHTDENRLIAYSLNDVSNLLVIINAASTAVIYYTFNRRYRELCLALVSKLLSCLLRCCCWCSWCWFRREIQIFLEQNLRLWDRRPSTMMFSTSTATYTNRLHQDCHEHSDLFLKHSQGVADDSTTGPMGSSAVVGNGLLVPNCPVGSSRYSFVTSLGANDKTSTSISYLTNSS